MKYLRKPLSEFFILWRGVRPFYLKAIFPLYVGIVYLISRTIKRKDKEFLRKNLWKKFTYYIDIDGFKFISERSLVSVHLMRDYEEKTFNFMKTIKGRVFIDVGAHVGRYSILLSKNFDKILAIEPDPYNFSCLIRNIYSNNLQNKILPLCVALSEGLDVDKLYLDELGSGSHSLTKTFTRYTYTILLPLDYIIEKIDEFEPKDISLIKIDVEGYEYEVLKGMENILRKGSPIIVVEIWDGHPKKSDTIQFLKNLGYRVEYKFVEDIGVTNYVFIKQK